MARQWVENFGGKLGSVAVVEAQRSFSGEALVRVRAFVQHDSYERLINVECRRGSHIRKGGRSLLAPVPNVIERTSEVGVDFGTLLQMPHDKTTLLPNFAASIWSGDK